MAVFYSPNGLPLAVKWTEEIGKEAMGIYTDFIALNQFDFEGRLTVMERAVILQSKVGNPFHFAVHEKLQLSTSARSFISQYVKALDTATNVGNMGVDSWMLLLAPGDDVSYDDPVWSKSEKEALARLIEYGDVGIIRRFIDGPGLNKYFELLRLWLMPVVG